MKVSPGAVTLRSVVASDIDLFDALAREVAEDALPLAADDPLLESLLDIQVAAYERAIGEWPGTARTVVSAGRPVGRVIASAEAGTVHILDLVVRRSERRRGIGEQAIRTVLREAARAGSRCVLSCRRNNPAQNLYRRVGFRDVGGDATHVTLEMTPTDNQRQTPGEVHV